MQVCDADRHRSLVAWSGCTFLRFTSDGELSLSRSECRGFLIETTGPTLQFVFIRFASDTYCGPGQRYSGLPDHVYKKPSRFFTSVT